AAIVRGTYWGTQETEAGTKVSVKRGLVAVRDFARKRTVLVGAGHSYTATPKRRTLRRIPAFTGSAQPHRRRPPSAPDSPRRAPGTLRADGRPCLGAHHRAAVASHHPRGDRC